MPRSVSNYSSKSILPISPRERERGKGEDKSSNWPGSYPQPAFQAGTLGTYTHNWRSIGIGSTVGETSFSK